MAESEKGTLDTFNVGVYLIVKARSQRDAESIAAGRLNSWFIESHDLKPPYPRGNLLAWAPSHPENKRV